MKWRFWNAMGISALLIMITAGCGSNSGGSSSDSVTVAAASCISCHDPVTSPVTGLNIVTEWQSSTHSTANAASCYDCHEPDPTHPSNCNQCHGGGTLSTDSARHDVVRNPDSSQKCYKCHGLSFPNDVMIRLAPQHFNNLTAGTTYPAQYVSSQYVGNCRKCHNPHNPTGAMARSREWADSGHGNTLSNARKYEFKTYGTLEPVNLTYARICVRCHTSTGYINYVNSGFTDQHAWGVLTDKTKELTGCNVCHDDGNGNAYGFGLRQVAGGGTGIRVYYNYSGPGARVNNNPLYYPDASTSNLCMLCHVGREIGKIIKDAAADGLNFSKVARINAHDYTAGATVFAKSGYEYTGRSYANPSFAHDQIGIGNYNGTGSKGPCITCHLQSDQSHSFLPVIKASDKYTITSVISRTCGYCHTGGSAWTATTLQAQKDGLAAALAVLNELLKNVPSSTNWIVPAFPVDPEKGPNTMGASFNYNLFKADPGAFAHNSRYVKRLLYDSIDWMNDGILNDDVAAAIHNGASASTVVYGTTKNPISGVVYSTGNTGGTATDNATLRAWLESTANAYLLSSGGRP